MSFPEVHVIVTGLLRRGDRALLVHRVPDRRAFPDCWDLPGGHVEEGEAPADALRRELREELGVRDPVLGRPAARFRGGTFDMTTWVVDRWDGEPANLDPSEHDAIAWMTWHETTTLTFAHGGVPTLLRDALRGD